MRGNSLDYVLRCYGRPDKNGMHIAVCLELSLVVLGDSPEQARSKLIEQIKSYVNCLDAKNFHDLFPRNASLLHYLDYYFVSIVCWGISLNHAVKQSYQTFKEALLPQSFQVVPA